MDQFYQVSVWNVDGKDQHWCRVTARLIQNPDTLDVEALVFGVNIDEDVRKINEYTSV